MYAIYADGVCIYNDVIALDGIKLINPKLTLSDCAAGSLTMTLPMTNVGYDTIERLVTDIVVKKDNEEIWMGRVLSESKDFWNNRVLYCEGELAFFNDSTQPPMEYTGKTIYGFLEALIEVHNSKVAENRRFQIGVVTVTDDTFPIFYTNYEKTMATINSLIEKYGGHMRVRKENGVRYLDYLKDCPNTCRQIIKLGSNLINFTKSWDMTEFATVIVPLGARLEDSPIEALDAYLTVESVNDGSIYVMSQEAIDAYGWIEKTIQWNDITDPETLLEKANAYLSDLQFDNMMLELSALDMHYLEVNTESVKLLDEIRVISAPHGLDRFFPVTKLEIPLDSPEKTQFKLGDTVKTSLTSVNNQNDSALLAKIEALPKAHSILKEARENAEAIMGLATTGYITITKNANGSEELWISDIQDYIHASKYWKWNLNGLAYYNINDVDPKTGKIVPRVAITMDGAIVADRITSGVLNANVIRAGIIQDVQQKNYWNLNTGEFRLAATTAVGDSTIAKASDLSDLVVSTDVEYGNSNNAQTTPTTWTTNASWAQGKYLWTRTKMTLENNTVQYSPARLIANGNGLGVSKVTEQYYLSTKNTTQSGGSWSETQPAWVKGRYYWTRNKIDWADGTTTYTDPVLAQALTSGNQSTDDLDSSFNQQKVFNRLTNNGETQGIYLSNGKVYINATYIATGTLADKNSNVVFDLANGKLTMKKGSIYLGAYDSSAKHFKFEVDENGNLYAGSGTFAGNLVGAKGTFKGVVQAEDFLDSSGQSMIENMKLKSKYLSLYGLTVTNSSTGATTFSVSATGIVTIAGTVSGKITMGSGSSINWNNVTESNASSSSAYKRANQAISDASDAQDTADTAYSKAVQAYNKAMSITLPSYIKSTYIDQTTIQSPTIKGGEFYGNIFNVISEGNSGSFNLYGTYGSTRYHLFSISYYAGDAPYINITSPDGGYLQIGSSNNLTRFYGNVNFTSATVSGLTSTAVFG